jgi:pre-mRNA 3'-end-processing factor FIP1
LAAVTGLDASTSDRLGASLAGATAQANSQDYLSMNQLPEGPPPPVPITAPRLELDPSEQSLLLPPETVDGEPGPIIYHVDPSEFEEKPWRRPGADLTDWFNYGFNEDSWKLWGEKKHNRTVDRRDMEANGGRNDSIMAEEEPQHVQVRIHLDQI